MRLRYKILIQLIIYILGIFTAVSKPIIKWSIIAPLFGRKVDIKKSIDGLALKEGVVLERFTVIPNQPIETPLNINDYRPDIIISQEYPSSQGFGYQQSINLNAHFAVMTYQNDWQPFWLGISNVSAKLQNLGNPGLFLNFNGKTQVKIDEKASSGWVEMDPNFTYYLKSMGAVQPGSGIRLNPLFVKFPTEGIYSISYSITSDNKLPISGKFDVKVVKQ
jgi:hypothetical protein